MTVLRSPRTRQVISVALRYIFLVGLLVVIATPFVWVLLGSFKPNDEILVSPIRWLPSEWKWENYPEGWRYGNFSRSAINSFIFSGAIIAGRLLISSMAGYGFAKFRFPGHRICFFLVLATMMLPLEVTLIPLFLITKSFGWLDTYQGMIIPVMVNAMAVFFMRQSMLSIPSELLDAARIDGASELRIFFSIVLPMQRTALAGLAVFTSLETWNNFLWPLVVSSSEDMHTLPITLQLMQSFEWTPYGQLLAMVLVIAIPPLLVFVLLQRQLVESGVLSGIKS